VTIKLLGNKIYKIVRYFTVAQPTISIYYIKIFIYLFREELRKFQILVFKLFNNKAKIFKKFIKIDAINIRFCIILIDDDEEIVFT
jgi:hypothetical protein